MMQKIQKCSVLFLLVFSNYELSIAQDATESPTSTFKGSFQGETGVFYQSFKEGNVTNESYAIGATLLLYGIRNNMEVRLGWDFQEQFTRIDGSRQGNVLSGYSPLQIGAAIDVIPENGILPQVSVLGDLFLPFTASKDFRPKNSTAEIRSIFYHTLSENSNFSYNLGAQLGDGTTFVYTIAYNQNFTNTFGFYAELYGDAPEKVKANHFWDIGITYLLTPQLQFDTVVGTGINSQQDLYWGARLTLTTQPQNTTTE